MIHIVHINQSKLTNTESHKQYGNNFFLLFEAMRIRKEFPERIIIQVYLEKAEKLESWGRFLEENQELIHRVIIALEGLLPYRNASKEFLELLRSGHYDDSEDKDVDNEADQIEALGIVAWNVLNPLLEEIGAVMDSYGLNQTDFFG